MTRDDFLHDLISQFVQRRNELELSQEDVEYKLGVADGTISKWERGVRTPTAFNLFCWAEALECNLELCLRLFDY